MERERTALITGATGMIGGFLVREALEKKKFDRIILLVRNVDAAKNRFGDLPEEKQQKLSFLEGRIEDIQPEWVSMPVDFIIHCACTTQSGEMTAHPVETADSIVIGTKNILELARKKQVRSMVYLSSMEVYGRVDDNGEMRKEDQLGEVDLQMSRSCYPMAKRMAEHYCGIYAQEYGVPVKIARLAQTFGRGVQREDRRVYMQFARAVCEGRDIILHTSGMSMGNYCAIEDTVDGIFTILDKGKNGETYNVVNEANTMRILDMAHLVATQVAGRKIQVRVETGDIMKYGYAPETGLRLSSEKLRKLGWRPYKGLVEMYQDVIGEIERM